ncbi:hypothetical protein IWW38_006270, partial [Coemansia aciculifera]
MPHLSPSPSGTHTPTTASSQASPLLSSNCVQTLTASTGAALAVAYTATHVFCGTQQGTIHAWHRTTFRLDRTLGGHSGGCHALAVDPGRQILFSGGGDGRVRAWDTRTLRLLFAVHAGVNSGAVL